MSLSDTHSAAGLAPRDQPPLPRGASPAAQWRARRLLRRAFTLIELLVVVSIIALLIAILLPALDAARQAARTTACISNIAQLTRAQMTFASDHFGKLPGAEVFNNTYPDVENCWVVHDTGVTSYETVKTLEHGSLWSYLAQQPAIYLCPNEDRARYIRSYSIGTYIDGFKWPGWGDTIDPARTVAAIVEPSDRLDFIDDSDTRNYNIGSWSKGSREYYDARGGAAAWGWGDRPADRHGGGNTHSFADGHAVFYRFRDPQTATLAQIANANPTTYMPAPNSLDAQYYIDIWAP